MCVQHWVLLPYREREKERRSHGRHGAVYLRLSIPREAGTYVRVTHEREGEREKRKKRERKSSLLTCPVHHRLLLPPPFLLRISLFVRCPSSCTFANRFSPPFEIRPRLRAYAHPSKDGMSMVVT